MKEEAIALAIENEVGLIVFCTLLMKISRVRLIAKQVTDKKLNKIGIYDHSRF
jgi:hypothetical protein